MAWIDIGNGVGVGEGEAVGVLVGGAVGVAVGTRVAVDGGERVEVDAVGSGAGCGMDCPQALSARRTRIAGRKYLWSRRILIG
jgi:hypothetical protein